MRWTDSPAQESHAGPGPRSSPSCSPPALAPLVHSQISVSPLLCHATRSQSPCQHLPHFIILAQKGSQLRSACCGLPHCILKFYIISHLSPSTRSTCAGFLLSSLHDPCPHSRLLQHQILSHCLGCPHSTSPVSICNVTMAIVGHHGLTASMSDDGCMHVHRISVCLAQQQHGCQPGWRGWINGEVCRQPGCG